MKKNDLLIYKLFLLFQLLIYVTAFILCIWTSKLIRIIFYLSFVIISFSCIYSFIFVYISFDLKIDYSHKTKLFNYTYKLFGILNLIIEILIFCCKFFQYLNDIHYGKYLKNCPFSLSSDLIMKSVDVNYIIYIPIVDININTYAHIMLLKILKMINQIMVWIK